jgi:dATP pyrophosphohydrolase
VLVNTRQYKRPESVLVVIHNDAGEVLILERTRPAGFWQSVTGSLLPDETPRAAALRELREETGLELAVLDCHRVNRFAILPAWRARYAPGVTRNREHVFIAACAGRPPLTLNPDEHVAYCWRQRDAAAALVFSCTNRAAILDFVQVHDA